MDLTALDWVLFIVAAIFVVAGMFQGFSGQLGSLAGLAAALVAGYFLFAPVRGMVAAGGWFSNGAALSGVAAAVDFVLALVTFGLVRRIVAKFVSFLVPQPANAIVGMLVGLVKAIVIVGLLTGAGLVQTGRFSEGFFAAHSSFVRMAGALADSYWQGASQSQENQT